MTENIVALERPTTDEALQRRMVETIREVLSLAERGHLSGVVMVPIKHDHSFRVIKSGPIRKLVTVGMLAQAQHDLLAQDDLDEGRGE